MPRLGPGIMKIVRDAVDEAFAPQVEAIRKRQEQTEMQDELTEKVAKSQKVQSQLRQLAKNHRDPNATHFANYGEALDKSGVLGVLSESHRLEKRENALKGAARAQGDPPFTHTPTIQDKGPGLPRGGADPNKPLNADTDWPVDEGAVDYSDLNQASAAHVRERRKKSGF